MLRDIVQPIMPPCKRDRTRYGRRRIRLSAKMSVGRRKARALRTDQHDGVVLAPRPDYPFLSRRDAGRSALARPLLDWFPNIFSGAARGYPYYCRYADVMMVKTKNQVI